LLRLVLTKKVRGQRRDGHWLVDAADIERVRREREREPAGAAQ